jgi:hypothetical protein
LWLSRRFITYPFVGLWNDFAPFSGRAVFSSS